MKTYIYIILSLLCILSSACKKDELLAFDEKPKVYIYKSNVIQLVPIRDSLTFSFAINPASLMSQTIFIPVRIIGNATNSDRKVNYEIMPSSTANTENYELLPAIIKANSFEGTLPILIKRTAALKTKEGKLWVRIIASEDFDPGVADQLSYLVKINDFLSKPASWSNFYFGKYSNVKYDFIIKTTNYTTFEGLGVSEIRFIAQNCKNALLAYEAQNGTLYDEDRDPVVFP